MQEARRASREQAGVRPREEGERVVVVYREGMRRLATILLLIAPVVLAAGFVLDHEAKARATQELASAVTEKAAATNVVATFEGFPFLTQAWANRFNDVNVTAAEMSFGDVTAHDVRAVARGVTRTEPHHAELVEINATLPLPVIQEALRAQLEPVVSDVTVTRRGEGLILHLSVIGQELQLLLGFDMGTATGIGLVVEDVLLGDIVALPEALRQAIAGALGAVIIDLSELPAGLSLTVARVVDDGLRIRLEGQDVELGTVLG